MSDSVLGGKVAIVTGAGAGIGRATALALGERGARLALFDNDGDGLEVTAELLSRAGARAESETIDLTETALLGPAVDLVVERFDRVDILANVAGVFSNDKLVDFDFDHWQRSLSINLTAPAVLMHHVARHLIAQGEGGRIVSVSSSTAFRAGRDGGAAYAAGKAGLVGLTRVVAAQLAPHGVNVNAVVPGLTASDVALKFRGRKELEQMVRAGGSAENLFERLSQPEDVAAAIVFLCLPESRQITAQAIHTSAGAIA